MIKKKEVEKNMKVHMKIKKKRVLMGILIVAVISVGTACGGNKTEEESLETVQEADEPVATELEIEPADHASNKSADEGKKEEQENVQAVTELSEAAQHQISAFIAAYAASAHYLHPDMCTYEEMQEEGPNLYDILAYICLQKKDYGPVQGTSDGLPFEWGTFIADGAWDQEPHPGYTGVYKVSKEEFRRFYENGLGIKVPENMEYRHGELLELDDWFYGVELGESGLGSTLDIMEVGIAGDKVEITGYEDGIYFLSGCFRMGASDEDGWEELDEAEFRYTFTATAMDSGDAEIFDGLQITDFHVEEKK